MPVPTSSTHVTHEDERALDIRSSLLQNPLFFGNPNLLSGVKWVQSGHQFILVKTGEKRGGLETSAVLEWVGEISPSNFWLYACAGWNGEKWPSNTWANNSPFKKAKLRAHIRQPDGTVFEQDWPTCIENLERLMSSAKKQDSKTVYSLLEDDEI